MILVSLIQDILPFDRTIEIGCFFVHASSLDLTPFMFNLQIIMSVQMRDRFLSLTRSLE